MTLAVYLQLAGIAVEIVGGFILAIDAIGLDRVQRWADALRRLPRSMTTVDYRDSYAYRQEYKQDFRSESERNRIGDALAAYGAVYMEVAWLAFMMIAMLPLGILMLIAFGLRYAAEKAKRNASGVIGFSVLTVGFLLQFAGTLIGGLNPAVIPPT